MLSKEKSPRVDTTVSENERNFCDFSNPDTEINLHSVIQSCFENRYHQFYSELPYAPMYKISSCKTYENFRKKEIFFNNERFAQQLNSAHIQIYCDIGENLSDMMKWMRILCKSRWYGPFEEENGLSVIFHSVTHDGEFEGYRIKLTKHAGGISIAKCNSDGRVIGEEWTFT